MGCGESRDNEPRRAEEHQLVPKKQGLNQIEGEIDAGSIKGELASLKDSLAKLTEDIAGTRERERERDQENK